jgi:Domain of Unknown Function (DUF928)
MEYKIMNVLKSTLALTSACFSLLIILTPQWTGQVRASQVTGFEPPPGRDAPRGGTVGGGSRPVKTCLTSSAGDLTALSPGRQLGLSQVDRPNFSVYLPPTTAKTAEFSLFDKQMNGIYQVSIPVPKQAGLVSISLPDNAPALVKDQPYYWTFALACNPVDRTEDWVVGGWVEYAQPNDKLRQQLASLSEVEKLSVYAKQGFWYDAITILVKIQRSQPNNPQLGQIQAELLKSGGLEAIATKPLE